MSRYVARDRAGHGYSVAARLRHDPPRTTAVVRTAVCAPDDTMRPGLGTTWEIDQAEAYALALLVAVARARVLLEVDAAHTRDANHTG